MAIVERLRQQLGLVFGCVQVANGSEFSNEAPGRWAYDQHVTLDFLVLPDAQEKIEHWRQEYKGFQPHSSL